MWYILFFLMIFASSCSSTKGFQKTKVKEYQSLVRNSEIFDQGFTGFQLFDPSTKEVIYSLNADKYFTPASNTKIFTFYASLMILKDSISAFKYLVHGDSMILWGTGDPSFNNPYLTQNEAVIDFLKNSNENLFFCSHNFQDERFGPGWAWDDYNYSFQPEKSSFPIYGNVVQFEKDSSDKSLKIIPAHFNKYLKHNKNLQSYPIFRQMENNIFLINPELLTNYEIQKDYPFKYTDSLFVVLLSDIIGKKVRLLESEILLPKNAKTVFSVPADTLYKMLMQESDNFIAEQLLLLCSDALFDTLNVFKTIQFVKDSLLIDLPDEANWVDGSGLSRYNMITPRSIVHLLNLLYDKIPQERLFRLFPSGGISGTISEFYKGEENPYVFAKTGTLRNKHCLSGYLIGKSGKVLIFSFMHNNFPNGSEEHKTEMEKVLKAIHLAY